MLHLMTDLDTIASLFFCFFVFTTTHIVCKSNKLCSASASLFCIIRRERYSDILGSMYSSHRKLNINLD